MKREAAHRAATGPGPPNRDEFILHSLWLSSSHVTLKVFFLVLAHKEEFDVMMIFLSPSLFCSILLWLALLHVSSPGDLCLLCSSHPLHLSLFLVPGLAVGQKSCVSFSSAFIPEHLFLKLIAASFSENSKNKTKQTGMYRKKNASTFYLAEETVQKMQSAYVQLWELLENGCKIPVLGNGVRVPGWVGHQCLRDRCSSVTPALSFVFPV